MPGSAQYKALVQACLTELGVRLLEITNELDYPEFKDLGEQAMDLENDEVLEGLGLAAQKEMVLLQAALTCIEDGAYCACQACGGPTSDARLQAVPHTVLCRNCVQSTART
ncbi:dimethylmenaquinone methyltransferase [Tateyamaria omphalii]|uniref:TraR/DksA family transcriptional regulator n=1 Tax=Tateyamaria omphalii TaxID=299262 RepID=UPI001672CFCB|nr:dimethylmenaquinone methyltransferase [Tateyamaria omphalii]